jgi:hypothetical protein
MQLREDLDVYDNWQSYFSYELLSVIRECLEKERLTKEQIKELTTSIGFQVSALLDASAPFSVEGKEVKPILTFSPEDEVLIHQGGPSHLHEYTHGNADQLFEERP